MTKLKSSIEAKINLVFGAMLAAILLMGVNYIYRDIKSKAAIKKEIQETLRATAELAAGRIDPAAHARIKPGDEGKPAYMKISDIIYEIQHENPDIKYLYTFRAQDGKKVKFVVDAMWGRGEEEDLVMVDEIYDETSEKMVLALDTTQVEDEAESDEWGTFLSGYAPIKFKDGKSSGAVGVDITSGTIREKQDVYGTLVNILFFTCVLFAAVAVMFISKGIIRDLNKLTLAAYEISKGNMDAPIKIDRKDEIGDLASSFKRMAASLRIMMGKD